MEESIRKIIGERFQCTIKDIRTYSPLTLAYIGDAVYDLIIRTVVTERANRPANELNRRVVQYVKASAQARAAEALLEFMSEEERDVYKRGRNAKPHTVAKNASLNDYRKATGLEALIGYLYLLDRTDRAVELVAVGIEKAGFMQPNDV